MKIAIWHNLLSGGAKRALYYHIEGLTKRGHEITAFCPDTVDQSYLPLSRLVKENTFPLKERIEKLRKVSSRKLHSYDLTLERLNLMLDHCRECGSIINGSNYDVFLANSSSDFYMSQIGRFVTIPKAIYLGEPFRPLYESFPELHWKAPDKNMRRMNCLFNIGNEFRYWKKIFGLGILAREELAAAKSYDAILTNSFYSRESIMRAYRLDSKVCYLGIDTEVFKPQKSIKENYVIGVGSFGHSKGIERAIFSISKISEEKRPRLIWIGNLPHEGYIGSLREMAGKLNVEFTAKYNTTDEELILYLQKAAVMIYLPILEPFGLAPLEANACGTAVVGIAEGGMRETIVDGTNGYLAKGFDSDEISAKIQLFTDNLMFAENMGRNARKYVQERWNYSTGITNIENCLVDLNGKKSIHNKAQIELNALIYRTK